MSATLTETERMTGSKKTNRDRNRLELVADPQLIARLTSQADRLGISLSAYVRQACTRQLERDEADAPPAPKNAKGSK